MLVFPTSLGFGHSHDLGVAGQSYSNFLASVVWSQSMPEHFITEHALITTTRSLG